MSSCGAVSPSRKWPSARQAGSAGRCCLCSRLLSRRKLQLAEALGSRALRADAVESITCGWLSFVVLIGLLAQLALGAWWVDAATSLVIVWLLIKEGCEAWKGDDQEGDRHEEF